MDDRGETSAELPELDEDFADKALTLDALRSENAQRLGKLAAAGMNLGEGHPGIVNMELLLLLQAIVRAGWGEAYLTDLQLNIEEQKAAIISQAERASAQAKLLNPLMPQQNGSRDQRRHG